MRKLIATAALTLVACGAQAATPAPTCAGLPTHAALKTALKEAKSQNNGGLALDMWATIVDRSGTVCAVTYTGDAVDSQWPGSRLISAQKANTANAFSLKASAFSTANLYSPSQPGGFMFGIQQSNPVNIAAAYAGDGATYGSESDPLVGAKIGGVNVFGGGLALYNDKGEIIGGLGVSGDTSCADHNIAWRARHGLKLDKVAGGVSPDKNDQIIYDVAAGNSASGFGHPTCGGTEDAVAKELPPTARK